MCAITFKKPSPKTVERIIENKDKIANKVVENEPIVSGQWPNLST